MSQYYGKDSMDLVVYGVAYTAVYLPVEEERQNETVEMTPTVMLFNHVAHGNPPTVSFIDSTNVLGTMKLCKFKFSTIHGDTYVSPSYEYYFNTPHHFTLPTDTFYISHYWPMGRSNNYIVWYYENWSSELGSTPILEHWLQPILGGCELDGNMPIQQSWYTTLEPPDPNDILVFRPNESQQTPTHSAVGYLFPIIGLRCTPPTQIRFVGREGNAATLSWWQPEAGESYQLSVGPYGSTPDTGMMMSTTDTFYTVGGLEPDVIYQAWVRKACHYYDTLVWSDWSRPASFRVSVGISAVEGDAAFSLSPNPAHGTVVLTLEQASEGAELTLCDLGGRELRHERVTGTSYTLDIAALPAGVYFLKLTTPRGVATRRLLVE